MGAIFVYGTDMLITYLGINSPTMMIGEYKKPTIPVYDSNGHLFSALTQNNKDKVEIATDEHSAIENGKSPYTIKVSTENVNSMAGMDSFSDCLNAQHDSVSRKRKKNTSTESMKEATYTTKTQNQIDAQLSQWKRVMLLVVAITVHNIPEGLAVGVSFGAVGTTESATFEAARNLAIGIGIQNFPEGLAVSLPLHAAGFSLGKSFWYGQLSGMVEPIFGILGAVAVSFASIILPYALSFAAGAMIYIVADDILPEASAR
jgi:zinc transporter 11